MRTELKNTLFYLFMLFLFMHKKQVNDSRERQPDWTHTAFNTWSNIADERSENNEMGKPATLKKILGYILALLSFMVVCAFVFSALESTTEHHQVEYWKTVKQDIASQFNLSDSELLQLVSRLDGVKKYGLSRRNSWDFYSSFWFTMTITTTIGKNRFGHLFP